MWEDYAALIKPIEMRYNVEDGTGTVSVPDVIEIEIEPIRNSITGESHRARVVLPHGFEFNEAELASASFAATGDLKFKHRDRSAIFSHFSYGPEGIVG